MGHLGRGGRGMTTGLTRAIPNLACGTWLPPRRIPVRNSPVRPGGGLSGLPVWSQIFFYLQTGWLCQPLAYSGVALTLGC